MCNWRLLCLWCRQTSSVCVCVCVCVPVATSHVPGVLQLRNTQWWFMCRRVRPFLDFRPCGGGFWAQSHAIRWCITPTVAPQGALAADRHSSGRRVLAACLRYGVLQYCASHPPHHVVVGVGRLYSQETNGRSCNPSGVLPAVTARHLWSSFRASSWRGICKWLRCKQPRRFPLLCCRQRSALVAPRLPMMVTTRHRSSSQGGVVATAPMGAAVSAVGVGHQGQPRRATGVTCSLHSRTCQGEGQAGGEAEEEAVAVAVGRPRQAGSRAMHKAVPLGLAKRKQGDRPVRSAVLDGLTHPPGMEGRLRSKALGRLVERRGATGARAVRNVSSPCRLASSRCGCVHQSVP